MPLHVYLREAPRALVLVPCSQADGVPSRYGPRDGRGDASPDPDALALVLAPAPRRGLSQGHTARARTDAVTAQADMVPLAEISLRSLRRLTPTLPAAGCLGLMNIGADLFLAVVTYAVEQGQLRPGERVMKITGTDFFCLNRSTWDDTVITNPNDPATYGSGSAGYDEYQTQPSAYDHPCAGVRRLLANGTFYSAFDNRFDLSSRLDRRCPPPPLERTHDIAKYEPEFVWNTYMLEPLISYRTKLEPHERLLFDKAGFLMCIIRGFVGTTVLPGSSGQAGGPAAVSLISRLSWKRAGTRINTRGIDDDGYVANFVESEVIFYMDGVSYSHVQLRGSVPVFWEQSGSTPLNTKVQITRPFESSERVFQRHWAMLEMRYGRVHGFNLLGQRGVEQELTTSYREHANSTTKDEIEAAAAVLAASSPEAKREVIELEQVDLFERPGVTQFDFHSISRQVGGIEQMRNEVARQGTVMEKTKQFAFSVMDPDGQYRVHQQGVIRTNCLDCLDRTNVVQDYLSQSSLQLFLTHAAGANPEFNPLNSPGHPVWSALMRLWGQNGDALSQIYAGTGALNTSFTKSGKKTLGGLLSNAVKSVSRTYMSTFQDKDRQNVIDLLLGLMPNQASVQILDLVHEAIEAELAERMVEFSSQKQVHVFVGTWNIGGKLASHEPVETWLKPAPSIVPEIFVIGFEEIVELNASQILMADSSVRIRWEKLLLTTLRNAYGAEKGRNYVVLRSEQLVGTAQLVIVREDILPYIRAVETDTKKTGLKGMSGNKGGVAVRFTLYDSSFCFVVAHLAAGQGQVEERNDDYQVISQSLSFSRGKTVSSHDHIVWLGDFNYRINLPADLTRQLALEDDYDTLYAQDQLSLARSRGIVFPGLEEGPIRFRPTYKYDVGKDEYDTSEKMRAPAWTDRILFSPDQMEQIVYFRAELRSSDHRPVYSLFQAAVTDIDYAKRRKLYFDILRHLAPKQYDTYIQSQQSQATQSNAAVAAAVRAGKPDPNSLPYPSGESYYWWPDQDDRGPLRTQSKPPSAPRPAPAAVGMDSATPAPSAPTSGTATPVRRKAPPPPRPAKPSSSAAAGAGPEAAAANGAATKTTVPGPNATASSPPPPAASDPPSSAPTGTAGTAGTAQRRPPPPAPTRD